MSKEHSSLSGFAKRAIHHAYDAYAGHGSLNPPVDQSSSNTFRRSRKPATRSAPRNQADA